MTHTAFVRPAWTPVTIAMMIIGFMVFWPLGLAMLAYILWGDRLEEFKSNVNRATDRAGQSFSGSWGRGCGHKRNGFSARTGNVAFDEWRDGELERLEEERRKLDEMRAEFDEYLRELRRARDSEEFEAFRKAHNARKSSDTSDDGPAGPKGRRSVPEV
ncbi:MAG: DUF2852 domain-containing protein [Nitratireductor sp.]